MSEFFCGYCLEPTEAQDYPTVCEHCRIGFCECGMAHKHHADAKPGWCPGCGAIPAKVAARFDRSSSTAGAYTWDWWVWKNLAVRDVFGLHRWLKEQGAVRYGVSSGWKTAEAMNDGEPANVWLRKETRGQPGAGEWVRDLTDEECALLGYRTKAEREAMANR